MKTCTICGITKKISEFHKSSRSKDGLNTRCKECCYKYIANYNFKRYFVNSENSLKEPEKIKETTVKEKSKIYKENIKRVRNMKKIEKKDNTIQKTKAEKQREYRKKNREKLNSLNREYRKRKRQEMLELKAQVSGLSISHEKNKSSEVILAMFTSLKEESKIKLLEKFMLK